MRIYRVSSVRAYAIPLVFVKTWLVVAMGQTRSLGWTNARLVQDKDEDGLACFSFEADEPRNPAPDMIAPIFVSALFQPGDGIRGVKVLSETNAITRLADIELAREDGDDQYDFVPFESDIGDYGFDADVFEQYNRIAGMSDAALLLEARKCERRRLARIPTRVEFKTEKWKFYRRTRYNVTSLEYCYPTDLGDAAEEAIRDCLPVAIAAGVAGFAGGPAAAVAAFVAALKGCVGAELAGKVSIRIDNHEEIGDWHRI